MQPQDGLYREYSDTNVWAGMWLALIIMQRVHSVLSLALEAATSACDIGRLDCRTTKLSAWFQHSCK